MINETMLFSPFTNINQKNSQLFISSRLSFSLILISNIKLLPYPWFIDNLVECFDVDRYSIL